MPWRDPINQTLTAGTTATSFAGVVVAQAVQSPGITLGSIVLALIGLATLWVRSHYGLARDRLQVAELKALNLKLQARLEAYEEIVRGRSECPSPTEGAPV